MKGSAAAIAMSVTTNISSSTQPVGKNPVSYLLGGVGTMLVLIGFALILLAWSYFKECSAGHSEEEINNRSLSHPHIVEHGDGGWREMRTDMAELSDDKGERVIVIMAGHEEPTFISKWTSLAVEI